MRCLPEVLYLCMMIEMAASSHHTSNHLLMIMDRCFGGEPSVKENGGQSQAAPAASGRERYPAPLQIPWWRSQ